ncbi:MAG: type II secretion system F family protein, partial [Candidatus Pacearchaeota archaeon]|nr:type II secretion system F family protein [Candidatus Pacearchaeota archaeon]
KLANQLSFGIPLRTALRIFAKETKNVIISRTVELIIQAELSGGEISSSLEAASKNVAEIEKIKRERRTQVYGMILQGYIIFLIFIAIMLFLQLKFFPLIEKSLQQAPSNAFEIIKKTFFYLLMIQAFFAGLVIGKLSEGSIKYGIKHSVILLTISYLLFSLSKVIT